MLLVPTGSGIEDASSSQESSASPDTIGWIEVVDIDPTRIFSVLDPEYLEMHSRVSRG